MFRAIGQKHSARSNLDLPVVDASKSVGVGPVGGRAPDPSSHSPERTTKTLHAAPRPDDAVARDLRRMRQTCHDARQELVLIAAMAENLERAADLRTDERQTARTISRQARNVACMLRGVFDVAPREDVDIAELLTEIVEQVQLISSADIYCAVEPLLTLECDATRLRRTMLNILDNAIRAAGPGGRVTVAARTAGDQVVVEVEDSGPGFGRGAPGLATIGLGVVNDWVTESGGRLTILDGTLGGTVVRVVVPTTRPLAVRVPSQRTR